LHSAAGEGGLRSLKQYVADLKPNQTEIYYLVGESAERVKSNPKLEAAREARMVADLAEGHYYCGDAEQAIVVANQAIEIAQDVRTIETASDLIVSQPMGAMANLVD
jgi:hypothetical protein